MLAEHLNVDLVAATEDPFCFDLEQPVLLLFHPDHFPLFLLQTPVIGELFAQPPIHFNALQGRVLEQNVLLHCALRSHRNALERRGSLLRLLVLRQRLGANNELLFSVDQTLG